jgi:LmbE family N-acetylglucosaminyl deacetylase
MLLKKNEFLKVCDFLKVDGYDIGYFDDEIKHLDLISQSELLELIEFKSKVSISKIKPTMVAIPTLFSTHQDHTQTYKICMSALREHPDKIKIMHKVVLSYESPEYNFWSAYSEFGRFSLNYYHILSKKLLKNKIKCLNFYRT